MQKNSADHQCNIDLKFMKIALKLAEEAGTVGEVPVGALIVKDNEVISNAYNLKESQSCATKHAEILAIEEASRKLNRWRLSDCTLYVSLEPCIMCAGALIASRVSRVVFSTHDPKAGALGSIYDLSDDPRLNHKIQVNSGLLQVESSQLLKDFFVKRRKKKSTKPTKTE